MGLTTAAICGGMLIATAVVAVAFLIYKMALKWAIQWIEDAAVPAPKGAENEGKVDVDWLLARAEVVVRRAFRVTAVLATVVVMAVCLYLIKKIGADGLAKAVASIFEVAAGR